MTTNQLTLQPSNKDDPNPQDFDLIGDKAWIAITPPPAQNPNRRNADIRIRKDAAGVHIEVYYFDDELGFDIAIEGITCTWAEMEAAWQAELKKEQSQ